MVKRFMFMIYRVLASVTLVLSSITLTLAQDYDARLNELKIELPPLSKPIANYVKAVRSGNLLFLAGHGPQYPDGTWITGKLGKDLTIEQGYEAARLTAISLLATIKSELGSLNKVKRIVKVTGMVNSTADFTDQPKVINGCSDLLVAVFGENGKHARAAVGMNSLPMNTAVEIDLILEIAE
ncbi:MAG TPA: RidA family protein [Cyclobacteriaceae bacterium]|nr:RidA family protein [Cyclobacteriaceae bacterium]